MTVTIVPAGTGDASAASRRMAIPPVASWTNPIRPESIAPRSVVSMPRDRDGRAVGLEPRVRDR